jgi:RHS repeat-associated protein
VLYRQNLVDAVMSELYGYDNLHQLTSFQRGALNATHDGIVGTPSRSQSWSPDALGNFNSVTTDGSTQTRTHNQQNEITSLSGAGAVTYDANGNTTADGSGNTFVYDAWNHLVGVNNGGTTWAAYGYDALGRRITETHGTTTTDLYLSSANQVLEERVGGVVQARNVWSPVYVNALDVRDQSSQHDGVLDQRLYAQQDANWNVTALVDASGNVVERYTYTPYGTVTVLNPDGTVSGGSSYNVPYGFQGMRTDGTVGVQFADNRVYSPTLMRWLQADPLGLGPDNNDYRMEGNGPTGAVDPTGLDAVFIDGAGQNGLDSSLRQSIIWDLFVDYDNDEKACFSVPMIWLPNSNPTRTYSIIESHILEIARKRIASTLGIEDWKTIDLSTVEQSEKDKVIIDIFGWSRGSAFAIKLARQLQTKGINVRFLGLVDPCARGSGFEKTYGWTIPSNVKKAVRETRDGDYDWMDRTLFDRLSYKHFVLHMKWYGYLDIEEIIEQEAEDGVDISGDKSWSSSHEDIGFNGNVKKHLKGEAKGIGIRWKR